MGGGGGIMILILYIRGKECIILEISTSIIFKMKIWTFDSSGTQRLVNVRVWSKWELALELFDLLPFLFLAPHLPPAL